MASNAGAKVFLDIMPRLGAGSLERVLQSISGRVGTFSGDINKSLGAGIGNSASTAMEREGARIDAALKSAQASVERSTEAMARSQDAQNVSFLKLKAAEANYTEQFASESEKRRAIQALERGDWDAQAAAAEASTSRQISAISRLESRRAAYEASLRASSRAEAGGAAATAGLNEAQRDKDAFGDAEAASLGRVGKAATVATAGIGIGLAGAMYEGTKRSMDLNQQLTLLTTSAGESTKNIGTLKQGVLDLQSQYGYSADDLTKALRTIEQSGYHGSDAIKVLTTTTKESVLENANLDSVAHLLTTTMEDYGDKLGNVTDVQGRANKAAELQVATIGQSKATLDEYTASLGSVEEYAHTAGVSISDLNASFAEMTQHGITPQQSTDYLKSNIRVLTDPKQGQTTELNNDHLSVAQVQGSLQTQGIAATDEMISKAIMAKMGPDGRVLLNTYNDSKDQRQSADTMLQALKNDHPDEYAIASQFATDQSAASANPDKAAGSAASGKAQDTFAKAVRAMPVADQGRLKQWQTTFQKSQGFNDLLRSGRGDSESYLQAMNRAFGTQEASQTAQNLTGSNYQGVLDRQGAINANANDSVFNKEVGEQQDNLKARLKDLDGSFHSFETELGDTTQGPLKWFVAGLADSVKWLTQHKGVMDSLIAAAGIAAGTLAAIKVTNSVSTLLGAKQPLGTRMASGAITKTGNAIKKTGAAIGKGGAIAANYVGSYSEEVAAVATGAKEGVAAGLSGMKAGAISAATTAKDKAVTAAGTAGLAIDATTTKAKQVGNAALDRTAAAMYMAPTVIGNKAGELSNRASLSGLALAEQAGMGASAAAGGIAAAGSKLKGAASKIGGAGGKVGRVGMGVAAAGLPIAMIAGSGKANADDGSGKKQGTDWSEYAIDAAVAAPAVPAVAGAVKSVGVGAVKTAKAAPAAASKAVDKGKNIASTVGNAASAVGDFGGGAATKAADSIGKAGKAIKDFQGGAKLAEKAVQAWKLAQGGLQAIMSAGPIGIVVVAIAALVAGVIYAYTHFKWFRDAVNDVWNWMKKFAEWVAKEFMQMWHSAINDLKEIWSFLYDKVFKYYIDQVKSYLNDFIGFFKNIGKGIGDVLGGIKDLFQGHTDGIKKIWDGLKEIAAAPVRFIVNTVYNDGILKLWNGVAGVFHLDSMKLTPIQFSGGGIAGDDSGVVHAAGGTVLPGYTPGRDSIPAMLSPGEGVAVPELVQAIGPGNFMALNRKYSKGRPSANEKAGLPIPHADGGGIFGAIGHAIGKVGHEAWDVVKDVGQILSDPLGYVKRVFDDLVKKAKTFGDTNEFAHAIIQIPESMANGVIDWVKTHLFGQSGGHPGDTPVAVGGSVEQWRGLAMQALVDEGFTPPEMYIDAMLKQIQTESHGDPNIYQQVQDVNSGPNAAAGLLQMTPATFEAFHDPRDPNNRLDPKANMDAALRDIRGSYGGDLLGVWGHGHGYDGGGIAPDGVKQKKDGVEKDSHKLDDPATSTSTTSRSSSSASSKQQSDDTAIKRAWSWIQSVAGTPYQYGSDLDCSGFLSGVYDSLLNRAIGRAFTTVSDFASLGFKKGMGGIFSIGVNPKADQAGHMAGLFNGHKIESGGSHNNIAIDGPAVGPDDSQFSDHWFLPGSMFVPAYTGKGASSNSAEGKLDNTASEASKQAQKKRDEAGKYSSQVQKEKDEAAKWLKKQKDEQGHIADLQAKLKAETNPKKKATLQKEIQNAQRAADNAKADADKANQRALAAQGKADKANADASDLDTKAKTYRDRASAGEDGATGATDNSGTSSSGGKSDSQQDHLMTPVEFGQQLGGLAVSGLLETFGLDNTVFADPNQSSIFKVAGGLQKAKYIFPQNLLGKQAPKDSNSDSSSTSSTSSASDTSSVPSPSDYGTQPNPDSGSNSAEEGGTPSVDPDADNPQGQAQQDIKNGNVPNGANDPKNPNANTKIQSPAQSKSLMDQLKNKPTHDQGGWLKEGLQIVNNLTGSPEPVLNPQQLGWLQSAAGRSGENAEGTPRALVHVENQSIHNGDYTKAAKEIAREMNRYRKGR